MEMPFYAELVYGCYLQTEDVYQSAENVEN
jgi:hypothetical protein